MTFRTTGRSLILNLVAGMISCLAWGQPADVPAPEGTEGQPPASEASAEADGPSRPAGEASSEAAGARPVAEEPGPSLPARTITLEEAQEMALRTHPSFRNLDEVLYQADLGIYQAWTMLLPNLSANASITRNQREITVPLPMPEGPPLEINIQDLWAKNFGVSVNLTLLNPRTIPLIKLAYDENERQRLHSRIQRNDLLFGVTSAYYQAYSMDEMIDVAKENLAMTEEFLKHTEALMTAGQATQIDVTRAEIQQVAAEKELANALDAKRKAMIALKYLIGEEEEFTVAGPAQVKPVEGDLASLKKRAVSDRLELREAAVARGMAERWRKETLTKFLPVFDVTYSWSWASSEGFTGANTNWVLIFGAKWDLFPGGARIIEYKNRQSEARMADNNIAQITRDIQQQVELDYLDIEQRRRNVEIADRQVALAEKNHYMIGRQFQAGLINSLDVIDAATKLSNQRILRVYERLQFDLAILTLKKNLGEYHSLSKLR